MRIMHAMLRCKKLDSSLSFYINVLGMKELRREEFTEGEFTLVYLGYDRETVSTVLELTYNWGAEGYDIGNGYGHLAIGSKNIHAICEKAHQLGYKVVRPAGPMKLKPSWIIAFLEDPDGYLIELIEE